MKRSTNRILTTHAGSLPYFDDVAPGTTTNCGRRWRTWWRCSASSESIW